MPRVERYGEAVAAFFVRRFLLQRHIIGSSRVCVQVRFNHGELVLHHAQRRASLIFVAP